MKLVNKILKKIVSPLKLIRDKNNDRKNLNQQDDLLVKTPRYPPFIEGIPAVDVDKILLTQHDLIQKIKFISGMNQDEYKKILLPFISQYASFVHLLPASEHQHHRGLGGLFRHGLEVAYQAMLLGDRIMLSTTGTPQERIANEAKWRFACLCAGLLHDIGKPITDLYITDKNGAYIWNPLTETLDHWLKSNNVKKYFVHWRADRYRKHEEAGILSLNLLLTIDVRNYLMIKNNSDIIEAVLHSISNKSDDIFSRIIVKADVYSATEDMKYYNLTKDEIACGVPTDRFILDAIRELLVQKIWKVNQIGAAVFVLDDGIYIDMTKYNDVKNYLNKKNIYGIPENRDTVADLLISIGVAKKQTIKTNDNKEYTTRYHTIVPNIEPEITVSKALKIDSPDRIFSYVPPVAIKNNFNSKKEITAHYSLNGSGDKNNNSNQISISDNDSIIKNTSSNQKDKSERSNNKDATDDNTDDISFVADHNLDSNSALGSNSVSNGTEKNPLQNDEIEKNLSNTSDSKFHPIDSAKLNKNDDLLITENGNSINNIENKDNSNELILVNQSVAQSNLIENQNNYISQKLNEFIVTNTQDVTNPNNIEEANCSIKENNPKNKNISLPKVESMNLNEINLSISQNIELSNETNDLSLNEQQDTSKNNKKKTKSTKSKKEKIKNCLLEICGQILSKNCPFIINNHIINNREISSIKVEEIEEYLRTKKFNLTFFDLKPYLRESSFNVPLILHCRENDLFFSQKKWQNYN